MAGLLRGNHFSFDDGTVALTVGFGQYFAFEVHDVNDFILGDIEWVLMQQSIIVDCLNSLFLLTQYQRVVKKYCMNAFLIIDLYCERTAPGLWNEPLNAFSNVTFLIAAYLALRIALRRGKIDPLEVGVIALGGAIGTGSFLFHIFANSFTEFADVIPIWSFVASFVLLIIYRSTDENLLRTLHIAGIAACISGTVVWFTSGDIITDTTTSPTMLNGSLQYAPALMALVIFAALTTWRRHPARNYIVLATVTFFVSLIFRSIDLAVCETTIIGTHFLWHLLNGAMVGILLQALVIKLPPQRA